MEFVKKKIKEQKKKLEVYKNLAGCYSATEQRIYPHFAQLNLCEKKLRHWCGDDDYLVFLQRLNEALSKWIESPVSDKTWDFLPLAYANQKILDKQDQLREHLISGELKVPGGYDDIQIKEYICRYRELNSSYPPIFFKILKYNREQTDPVKKFEREFDPEKYLTRDDRFEIATYFQDRKEYDKAHRLCACHRDAIVLECGNPEDSHRFYAPYRCELRICPLCGFFRFKKVFKNLKKKIKAKKLIQGKNRLMLLTLTKKKDPEKDCYSAEEIKTAFKQARKLMNKLYRKKDGCGGLGVMEIGKSGNLHIHILVCGRYVPKTIIRAVWWAITGDSYIVDIKGRHPKTKRPLTLNTGLGYVLKDITKPAHFVSYLDYVDLELALRGVRRIHRFGIFYDLGKVEDKAKVRCPYCGCKLMKIDIQYGGWLWDGRPETITEACRRKRGSP